MRSHAYPPSKESSHYPFWQHLLAGGWLFRNDTLNNVQEILCSASLDGYAEDIQYYGYADLTILPIGQRPRVRIKMRRA